MSRDRRSVGETSLASVGALLVEGPNRLAVRVNCDGSDDFGSIWRKVFSRVTTMYSLPGYGFTGEDKEFVSSAADSLPEDPKPHDVRCGR